jgi:hypothetical protein
MLDMILLLEQWLAPDRMERLAQRVAAQSRLAVWERVQHRIHTLPLAECRGYLRARAGLVVQEETDRLLQQEGSGLAAFRQQIAEKALSRLIDTILDQVRRQQPAVRRAA